MRTQTGVDISTFSLRLAGDADYEALAAAKLDAALRFGSAYPSRPLKRDLFEAHVKEGRVIVAQNKKGQPQGYALYWLEERDIYLHQLFVARALGEQGAGAALLEAVCEIAQKEERRAVTLITWRDVPWTYPFYSRHGFCMVPVEETGRPFYLAALYRKVKKRFEEEIPEVVAQIPMLARSVAMERRMT